jgi:hypothetical protein
MVSFKPSVLREFDAAADKLRRMPTTTFCSHGCFSSAPNKHRSIPKQLPVQGTGSKFAANQHVSHHIEGRIVGGGSAFPPLEARSSPPDLELGDRLILPSRASFAHRVKAVEYKPGSTWHLDGMFVLWRMVGINRRKSMYEYQRWPRKPRRPLTKAAGQVPPDSPKRAFRPGRGHRALPSCALLWGTTDSRSSAGCNGETHRSPKK